MAVTQFAMGQLSPVHYFINAQGEVALPPSSEEALRLKDLMSKRGYDLREANTLAQIDELQRYMERREFEQAKAQLAQNDRAVAERRAEIRDRLISRMTSSSTSAYERDFIKAYLQLRDDKREHYRSRFLADISARFVQRDYDHPTQHLLDQAERVPDMKDLECPSCHKYRVLDHQKLCFRCLYGLEIN